MSRLLLFKSTTPEEEALLIQNWGVQALTAGTNAETIMYANKTIDFLENYLFEVLNSNEKYESSFIPSFKHKGTTTLEQMNAIKRREVKLPKKFKDDFKDFYILAKKNPYNDLNQKLHVIRQNYLLEKSALTTKLNERIDKAITMYKQQNTASAAAGGRKSRKRSSKRKSRRSKRTLRN